MGVESSHEGAHIRIYADTSVYGGLFDEEFSKANSIFFDHARSGYFQLVISDIVREKIETAPSKVQDLFAEMSGLAELIQINEEDLALRRAYLKAGIVTTRSLVDALHVAAATVFGCRAIVSWNFHHIVH